MQPDFELWLDVHISPAIAKWLKEDGYSVKSSYMLQLHQVSDLDIYHRAKQAGNIVFITKDSDLPEIVGRLGSPPRIINIKAGNCDNKRLYNLLKINLPYCIKMFVQYDLDIINIDSPR